MSCKILRFCVCFMTNIKPNDWWSRIFFLDSARPFFISFNKLFLLTLLKRGKSAQLFLWSIFQPLCWSVDFLLDICFIEFFDICFINLFIVKYIIAGHWRVGQSHTMEGSDQAWHIISEALFRKFYPKNFRKKPSKNKWNTFWAEFEGELKLKHTTERKKNS